MKKNIFILILVSMFLLTSCGAQKLEVINEDTGEVLMTQEELDRAKKTALNMGLITSDTEKLEQDFTTIGADDFALIVSSGEYTVLDLRTTGELQESGIIGDKVLQIDVYNDPDYLKKLQKLDPDEKYAIYCRSGGRTGSMMNIMKGLNFKNVVELEGGIGSWSRSGKLFTDFDDTKLLILE